MKKPVLNYGVIIFSLETGESRTPHPEEAAQDILLVCPNPRSTSDSPETQIPTETDPAELLSQLLDELIALGDIARRLNHALGGNGHRPGEARELIEKLGKEVQ